MIIKEIIQKLHTTMVDARGQESHFESWLTQNEGICDAIDMLKELAKQEQGDPVAWMKPHALCDRSCMYVCTEGFTKFPECATTQQQRTWVGLSYEEAEEIYSCIHGYDAPKRISEAIEAKLKEKNT
jgi:hypothetical protein